MSKLLSEYLNEFASAHGLRMANAGLPSGYDTIMGFAELAIKLQTENAELKRRVDIVEAQLKMVCQSEEIHHPDCPQFTGPYDLGELEPACICGLDQMLA